MKLISDIINELLDYGAPISGALLKTKVLAARIHNNGLLEWVNGELNGYEEQTILPAYRITSGILSGNYMNGQWKYSDTAMPISHLTKKESENLTEITIRDSLSSVEDLIIKKGIKISVSSQQKTYLEQTIRGIGNPYFQILNVHLDIPASFFTNIIAIVRSKLLDFMLEVENQFGHQTEIDDLKSKNALITQIMNTTINSNGDGVIITAGSNNEVNANVNIYKADKNLLKEELQSKSVESADIEELLTLIDEEPTTVIDRYSNSVNNWIKKMLNKAVDGSWQVGIGAAGAILGDAIAKYYGLK
jgi:hypothetical protein